MSAHAEPCRAGDHVTDENGNSLCPSGFNMADEPCSDFRSLGFGPEGDWEHSFFCLCGWERSDHATWDFVRPPVVILNYDAFCAENGLDPADEDIAESYLEYVEAMQALNGDGAK